MILKTKPESFFGSDQLQFCHSVSKATKELCVCFWSPKVNQEINKSTVANVGMNI